MKSKLLTTLILLVAVVFLSALSGTAQTSCAPLAPGCLDNTHSEQMERRFIQSRMLIREPAPQKRWFRATEKFFRF